MSMDQQPATAWLVYACAVSFIRVLIMWCADTHAHGRQSRCACVNACYNFFDVREVQNLRVDPFLFIPKFKKNEWLWVRITNVVYVQGAKSGDGVNLGSALSTLPHYSRTRGGKVQLCAAGCTKAVTGRWKFVVSTFLEGRYSPAIIIIMYARAESLVNIVRLLRNVYRRPNCSPQGPPTRG